MKTRNKRIINRIAIALSILVLVVMIAAWAFSTFYLNDWLTQRLKSAVHTGTQGRYTLAVDNLQVNLLGQRLSIDELHLMRDASVSSSSGIGILDKHDADLQLGLEIQGWDLFRLLRTKELDFSRINLQAPKITLHQLSDSTSADTTDPMRTIRERFLSISTSAIHDILKFDHLHISNAAFDFYKPQDTISSYQLEGFQTEIKKLEPNVQLVEALESLDFGFTNLALITDGNNWLEFGVTELADSQITLSHMSLTPRYSKTEAAERKGHQASWVQLDLRNINMKGVQPITWVKYNTCELQRIDIDTLLVDSYRDRSIPTENKARKKVPVELLEQLPFYLHVDSLNLNYGHVLIEEEQVGQDEIARLTLNDISASVSSIYTDTDTAHPIQIQGSFKIDEEIPVTLTARLMTHLPHYPFAVSAWSSGGELQIFNPFLAPSTGLELKSGTCHHLAMHMQATDAYANGTVDFEYSALQLQPADDKKGLNLKTLIGNVVLRNKNLKEQNSYLQADVTVERVHYKQIFHYLILFLRTGLKETVGIPTRKPTPKINIEIPNPFDLFKKDHTKKEKD